MPRGFLQILYDQGDPPKLAGSGRLELAQWVTDPANPLPARVMVNRIWQHHFGKGSGRHAERFRQARNAADASRAARLPRHQVRRERLVRQGDAPR